MNAILDDEFTRRTNGQDYIVCWRHGRNIRYTEFLFHVAHANDLVAGWPYKTFGLYFQDSYLFLVWLTAMNQNQRRTLLLPNFQQNFIQDIEREVDFILTDQFLWSPDKGYSSDVIERKVCEVLPIIFNPDAEFIVFTSGSTGKAKKIVKRFSQLLAEVYQLEMLWGQEIGLAWFRATVTHQHIYGLLFKVLWPFLTGRTFDNQTYSYPEALFAHMCEVEGCSVLVSSPAHLKRIPGLIELEQYSSRLVKVFSSGGSLETGVAAIWYERMATSVTEVYGSSETGGVAYRQTDGAGISSWQVFPEVHIQQGERGQLLVYSVQEGSNDWYETQDQVELVGDHEFILLGRLDRIVKLEEKRLSFDEVERALARSSFVLECRALVTPGKRQRLSVVVVLSAAGRAVLEAQGKMAVNQYFRQYLEAYFEPVLLPKRWRYVEVLPMDAQGKTTQAALLSLFLEQEEGIDGASLLAVRRLSEMEVHLDLFLPQEIIYFEGHFESFPILPGVVQVHWAIRLAQRYFCREGKFSGLEAVKFQHILQPNGQVTLALSYQNSKHQLSFKYFRGEAVFSSGRVKW